MKTVILLGMLNSTLMLYSCNLHKDDQRFSCEEISKNYRSFLSEENGILDTLIKRLEIAVQVDPTCKYTYSLLGELHMKRKEYRVANLYFLRALKTEPRNVYFLFQTGLSFKEQGIYDSAVMCFNKAERLKNNNGYVIDYSDQFDELTGSPITDIKYSTLLFHRAVANFKFGDYLSSINDLNYCIKDKTELQQAYFYRALIYAKIKDWVKACADYLKAKSLGNDSIEINFEKYSIKCP